MSRVGWLSWGRGALLIRVGVGTFLGITWFYCGSVDSCPLLICFCCFLRCEALFILRASTGGYFVLVRLSRFVF